MESVRAPSPIAEEVDEDDLSSAYAQTIKRLIQRNQHIPDHNRLSWSLPNHLRRPPSLSIRDYDQHSVEMCQFSESRSVYSVNEFASSPTNQERPSQFETSFGGFENELSSTDNQGFEFALPTDKEETKAPAFARRYFTPEFNHDYQQDLQSGDQSDSTEPDLNTKWSWKSLKQEFRLSHSESLFHLYQAKLQHSFFVALLILNIIFNLGAIISYSLTKYHEMNLCKSPAIS